MERSLKDQEKQGQQGEKNKESYDGGAKSQEAMSSQDKEKIHEMSEKQARLLLEGYREQEESKDKYDKSRTRVFPEILKDW